MITLGKLRGLAATAGPNGTFSMLALDHRSSFRRMTADILGGEASWDQVVDEKVRLADALLPHATAVLMDPLYASGPLVARGVIPGGMGFLVALERSGYDGPEGARENVIEAGWTVEAIKRMGAAGVKLLIHYHPDAPNSARQIEFVQKVAADCGIHDLVLVLEPVGYNPIGRKSDSGYVKAMPDLVVETAKTFDGSGADMLKLEFPLLEAASEAEMKAACEAVTDATRLPWVVLSGGVPFDDFLAQVRASCTGGASGFLGGRAIWKEAMNITDPAGRDTFLTRVAAPRIAALRAVTDASATPWTERPVAKEAYQPKDFWHKSYAQPLRSGQDHPTLSFS